MSTKLLLISRDLPALEEAEAFLLFPLRDRLVEAVPPVLLMKRVEAMHRVAEHMPGEGIGGKTGDRLVQVSRQRLHLEFVAFLSSHFVKRSDERGARINILAHAVERGCASHGQTEIRVHTHVDGAVLNGKPRLRKAD